MSAVQTSRIKVGDVELAVDQAGGGGRPLLLVHGFCGCRDDFTPIIPALVGAGWHVAVADNRGHGDSDQPDDEGSYGFEAFAGDTLGLADALGWERFTLLGHSLGGAVAQLVALDAPARVAALVLLNTTNAGLAVEPDTLAAAAAVVRAEGIDRLMDLMDGQGADPLTSPAHERAAAAIPGYRERGGRNSRRCSSAMYARMMGNFATAPDRAPALAALACPTLVAVGDEDRLMLGPSHVLAEAIPGARLAVIAGAGHNPQFEQREALLDVLLEFLGSTA